MFLSKVNVICPYFHCYFFRKAVLSSWFCTDLQVNNTVLSVLNSSVRRNFSNRMENPPSPSDSVDEDMAEPRVIISTTNNNEVQPSKIENDCNSESLKAKDSQTITIGDKTYSVVKEGRAEVLFPLSREVFYNPVQEFNRDMSIAVIRAFVELWKSEKSAKEKSKPEKNQSKKCQETKITLLEALAASGLRSIRYALEIPGVDHITANDVSHKAYEAIAANVQHNKVEHIVHPSREEASLMMYKHRIHTQNQYVIIDLDPYGTAAPFLDAAVQSVADGGLLLVTCTDLAVLCGNGSEKCRANYGAMSLKSKCCHEIALRIVLQSIESHANRYGRYIVPLLSLSADFYVRVFVRIYTSPIKVKESASKLGLVYQCKGCEMLTLQPVGRFIKTEKGSKYSAGEGPAVNKLCEHCHHQHSVGGPLWISQLHSRDFLLPLLHSLSQDSNSSFGTIKRMIGTLNVILEELEDCPLYYSLDRLAAILHTVTPKMAAMRSAILNAGYKVSYSHCCKTSIKTDAPPHVLWDIMRAWAKKIPSKRKLDDRDPAKTILEKEPKTDVSFEEREDAMPASVQSRLLRFPLNPEPNWGPKPRPKASVANEENEKSRENQGKRSKTVASPDRLKQFPCKRFKAGKCEWGDDCCYSHEDVKTSEVKTQDRNSCSTESSA